MNIHTSLPADVIKSVEGMVADAGLKTIISRRVETAEGIGFGRAVVEGSDYDCVVVPMAVDGAFRGLTVRDATLPRSNGDSYLEDDEAPLMVTGSLWVVVHEPVEAGDTVSFEIGTGALGTIVDERHDVIAGAIWDSSAAPGQIAKVRLG